MKNVEGSIFIGGNVM